MADQTISQLNLLAAGSLAANDELPIVDISASETKKIRAATLVEAGIALITNGSIDLVKLDQNSTTKIGTAALADAAITAAKLNDNSSIVSASTSPGANNFTGKGWFRSTDQNLYIYSAGSYQQVVMPTAGIADGAVTTVKIAANAVTDAKIQSGGLTASGIATDAITTIKILDGNVTTSKLANSAVTGAKIAASTIDATKFTAGAVDTAALAASGITSVKFAAGAVDTTALGALAVTNAKIAASTIEYGKLNLADGSVPGSKITSATISGLQLAASAVGTSAIADSAVTAAKIVTSGVTAGKIDTNAVTTATIAAGAVTAAKIGAEAVTTAALATSGITSAKFAAGAVDTTALGSAVVTNDKIANATIAYAKLNLSDGDVPGTKITSATISGLQISTGGVLTANIADSAITNAKIASGTIGVGKFTASAIDTVNIADDAVTLAKIADSAVGSAQLVDSGVTAIKLANSSSTVVQANAPVANGTFTGQQFLDTSTGYEYTWNGAAWQRQAAINEITFNDSTPLTFSVAYADNFSAQITTGLDNQTANRIFAGPISGSPSTPTFRNLAAADLPLATAGTVGAVLPGAGLQMGSPGTIQHSNSTTAGTFAGAITIDAQGHIVSASTTISAADVPDLDASKITTGTFSSAFLAANSVTAAQLADYGIAQVSESAPTPEFAGQWWINPNDRSAYIWVGAVSPSPEGYWLNLGYGSPTQINLRFGGTYSASGNVVQSINSYGIEAGLTIGQPLSSPNTSNNGVYLICTSSGVGTTPAPNENLAIGNWVLSEGVGSTWTKVTLSSAVAGVGDQDVLVDGSALIPVASGVASQEDLNEILWARAQIANLTTAGIVRASTEIAVASGTGEMSIGTVDDGSY
jgi:hypothetical protein